MIRLEVGEYCHRCPEFEVDSDTCVSYSDNIVAYTETIIICSHRKKCESITNYLLDRGRNG